MATEQHSMSIWDVIRRHHQLHPEDSLRKIAHEIGVAPSTVHRVLWLSELGQLEPKPRGGQRARVDPMELYLIQLMAKHEVSAATRAQLFSIFNQLCLRYLERPTELKLDTFLYHLKKSPFLSKSKGTDRAPFEIFRRESVSVLRHVLSPDVSSRNEPHTPNSDVSR